MIYIYIYIKLIVLAISSNFLLVQYFYKETKKNKYTCNTGNIFKKS